MMLGIEGEADNDPSPIVKFLTASVVCCYSIKLTENESSIIHLFNL